MSLLGVQDVSLREARGPPRSEPGEATKQAGAGRGAPRWFFRAELAIFGAADCAIHENTPLTVLAEILLRSGNPLYNATEQVNIHL